VRRTILVAVALVTSLVTTACTSADPVRTAAPASPLPPADVQATMVLRAQNVPQVGTVVVDSEGYTLYRFDKDSARPPKSTCLEDCWMKWPPLIHTSDLRLEGIDQALVGTVVRPEDSSRQVTIGGWPVYRYAGDAAPGEAKGHGVGNVWFAVTPTGRKAAGAPANNNGAGNNGAGNNGAGNGASNGAGNNAAPGNNAGAGN
jgi:predicted lipoprotein with Yx(FWY)xxD motif